MGKQFHIPYEMFDKEIYSLRNGFSHFQLLKLMITLGIFKRTVINPVYKV